MRGHKHICDLQNEVYIYRCSNVASLFGRAFSIGSRLFFPRKHDGAEEVTQEGSLVRQLSICQAQKMSVLYAVFVWYPKYIFSKKFRAIEIMKSLFDEMNHYVYCRKHTVNYEIISDRMIHTYPRTFTAHMANSYLMYHFIECTPDSWSKFYDDHKIDGME